MDVREYLEKSMRRLSSTSIAWHEDTFIVEQSLRPVDLVDAAVDIAWDELMPKGGLDRPSLEVTRRDGMIVFGLARTKRSPRWPQAA
nr:MAG: hypothetical protein KatS3mg044_0123 [Rhodothermaceae bacterium]